MSSSTSMNENTPFAEDYFCKLVEKYLNFKYIPIKIKLSQQFYHIKLFLNLDSGSYQIGAVGYGGIHPFPNDVETFYKIINEVQFSYSPLIQITLPPLGEKTLNWNLDRSQYATEILETYILDLVQYRYTGDKLFLGRVRTDIRFAKKNGVVIRECTTSEDLEQFYNLYKKTMLRVKSNYLIPLGFMEDLIKDNKHAKLYLALLDKNIIAGSLFLYNEQNVFYWINGSNIDYRKYRPNYLILKTAIDEFSNSKNYLNFGYSHNKNISKSKEAWGCKLQQYIKLKEC